MEFMLLKGINVKTWAVTYIWSSHLTCMSCPCVHSCYEPEYVAISPDYINAVQNTGNVAVEVVLWCDFPCLAADDVAVLWCDFPCLAADDVAV